VKPTVKIVAVVLAIQVGLVVAWVAIYWKNPQLATTEHFLAWAQTIAFLFTAAIVAIYTEQTHRIRKTADEQMEQLCSTSEFDAYTKIHAQLSNERSCRSRRHLFHRKFKSRFADVAGAVLGPEYRTGNEINCKHILENLAEDDNKLADFNNKLVTADKHNDGSYDYFDFCDALEMVLLDFDVIAGPLYRGNKNVIEAVEIYKNVIQATAPMIRPFVAIQMKLRGGNDYKKHYRFLLQYFDLLGELPEVKAPNKMATKCT
jgi:hypothetical protein